MIAFILTFIGVPAVCLILGRPLMPALGLAWGYWACMWAYRGWMTMDYLAAFPEPRRRTFEQMGELMKAWRPTPWASVRGFLLGFGRGFTLGAALVWGGMP